MDTKDPKRGADTSGQVERGSRTRDDEATSKETLSDLEESQKVPTKTSSDTTGGTQSTSAAPSPDGQLDETGGGSRADGNDSGGPM